MKIVIIPNEKKDKRFVLTKRVIDELISLGAEIFLDAAVFKIIKDDKRDIFHN